MINILDLTDKPRKPFQALKVLSDLLLSQEKLFAELEQTKNADQFDTFVRIVKDEWMSTELTEIFEIISRKKGKNEALSNN